MYEELDMFNELDLIPVFSYLPLVRDKYDEWIKGISDKDFDDAKDFIENPSNIPNYDTCERLINSHINCVYKCAYEFAANYDTMCKEERKYVFRFIHNLSMGALSYCFDIDCDSTAFYYGFLIILEALVCYYEEKLPDD